MYAVVRTGGKQYVVKEGDLVRVEKLDGKVGDSVSLGEVLLVSGEGQDAKVGKPLVSGAEVKCKIVAQDKAKKVIIVKHKRRKNYHRTRGHRQQFTALKIEAISVA